MYFQIGQVNNGQSVGPQLFFPLKGVYSDGNYTAPVSVYVDLFNNVDIVFSQLPEQGKLFHYFPSATVEEPDIYWNAVWRDIALIGIGVVIIMSLLAIMIVIGVFYVSRRYPHSGFSSSIN
jgi:hypothetical protein